PQSRPGDDLKKMLEDLMGGTRETKIPEPQVVKPKPQVHAEKPKYQHPVPHPVEHAKVAIHTFDKEKAAAIHAKQATDKPKPFSKKVLAEPVAEEEPVMDFDIRHAFIYS